MNSHLERIRVLDQQITKLDQILWSKQYQAAGLKIEITVGVEPGSDLTVELGVTSDLESILMSVLRGLIDCRKWRLAQAELDYKELKDFFFLRPTT